MELIRNFPLFTIILSLFSGALSLALGAKASRRYTLCVETVLAAMVAAVLWYTWKTGTSFTYSMGEFPAPWGNEIRAGVLEALLLLFFLVIIICSLVAGRRFLEEDLEQSKLHLYYGLINLMTAAMLSMGWTNDIFSGYVFIEILTLTSCGILIVREIGRTTLAAVRYMIMNLVGSGLFLLGVVLLYDLTGNLLMVPMQETVARIAEDPVTRNTIMMSLGILTIGLSIKSGLFPFHFWMPDTYGWATPASASLLSSVISKCYIFLLIKIYWRCIGIEIFSQMQIGNILFVLGLFGMVFGSVSALRARSINRMVAFSSAAQIGYIYMGIGISGTAGYTAAIFHIFAHSLTKSLLFLTTPRLAEVSGGSLLFKNMQGSGLKDRDAGLFFMLAGFSMIGIPIFAGFSSKLLFAQAAMSCGSTRKLMLTMLILAASSLLTAMYFIRTTLRIYTRPAGEKIVQRERHDPDYLIPAAVLLIINLFLGLFSGVTVSLIEQGFSMFS